MGTADGRRHGELFRVRRLLHHRAEDRVTLLLADLASYQGDLTPAQLWGAGFGGVNIKVSHGLTQRSVHPRAAWWTQQTRAAGKALSCFHWLTGDASGQAQADYAYRQMAVLGLNVPGVAHVVDVEATDSNVGGEPREGHYLDYVARMAQLLGRDVMTYSGRWWWKPRGWAHAPRSPWLWAAPGAGYLPAYPGDDSPSWDAGYGGWESLAVMQYRVAPVAGINVSQSAVRSPYLWTLATGGVPVAVNSLPASTSLVEEINYIAPNRSKASDGTIGNQAHADSVSDHNPDETGNVGNVSDSDHIDEVHARDVTAKGPWPAGWSAARIVGIIVKRSRSGQEKRTRYVIHNRKIYKRSNGWVEEDYTGPNPHTEHFHVSFMYGSGSGSSNPENDTSPWGIKAAYDAEQEETEMPFDASDKTYLTAIEDRIVKRIGTIAADVLGAKTGDPSFPNRTVRNALVDGHQLRDLLGGWGGTGEKAPTQPRAGSPLALLLAAALRDSVDVDETAIVAGLIGPLRDALVQELPEGTLTAEDVQNASERALRKVLIEGIGSSAS
jgi:hypothetical protein